MSITESHALPERNPAHPQALNMGDLERGMKISRHYVGDSVNHHVGIVFGEPFVQGDHMFITVATIVMTVDFQHELVTSDWNLGDMGVFPYVDTSGVRWNPLNYTLAVE